ncbi:hypothetical protein HYW55_06635 [Candidatus Gottesmanbacteria bacterium]|nr:hypothetical protein [Candidatus Gottesmanbacteria bacterium]
MENYPIRKPASASSQCSIPSVQNSPLEGGSFASMSVDSNSSLYVTDFHNNRVLKYIDPFTTDTIADDVWGQVDFSGNKCNFTDGDLATGPIPPPTDQSLCMGRNGSYQESFVAGVDVDQQGNIWVADSSNHRVLRFPAGSKTADLVLGQPNFTSRNRGSSPNQMNEPAVVRVDGQNGWVYVADEYNDRISIFQPPFTNGMNYSSTFGSQLRTPAGIEFDPNGEGIWVADHGNNMLELWSPDGSSVKKVLFKDTYQPNGQCGSVNQTVCINPQNGQCWDNMCDSRGSIGLDSDGNVFVSSSIFNQDVHRYEAPIPTPVSGQIYSANHRLFYPPDGHNLRSSKSPFSPRGMVIANNQFILSDGFKIVFWDDLSSLTNGKPADGYAGVNSFEDVDPWTLGRIAADNQNHLWVLRKGTVDVYQLPLSIGAQPLKRAISFETPLPILGGGTMSWNYDGNDFIGIDVDPSGNFLWLAQPDKNRVLRIQNPFTTPVIDVVLGQTSPTGTDCNRIAGNNTGGDPSGQAADTICMAGAVKIDRLGNVWVADNTLEYHGNKRILKFNASKFTNLTTALFAPDADLVSPRVGAYEMAFDSSNRMAVGYSGIVESNSFSGIYLNPSTTLLTSKEPDIRLNDFFSHGYSSLFDSNNNLYIADLNRGRVLVYFDPLKNYPPSPTPSPSPIPSSSPTLTPTPFPTATPKPTATPTRTPTPSPAPKTTTFKVSTSTDDVNQDGDTLSSSLKTIWLGTGSTTTASYTGLRFQNISIPKGAKILSAKFEVYSPTSPWISMSFTIRGDNIGNSPIFTNTNKPSQRALTQSKVNHSSNSKWTANTWYSFGDISPIIQEIVNKSDWNSGNNLSLILKGTGAKFGRKFVTSFDGSASLAPKLTINYK